MGVFSAMVEIILGGWDGYVYRLGGRCKSEWEDRRKGKVGWMGGGGMYLSMWTFWD